MAAREEVVADAKPVVTGIGAGVRTRASSVDGRLGLWATVSLVAVASSFRVEVPLTASMAVSDICSTGVIRLATFLTPLRGLFFTLSAALLRADLISTLTLISNPL